MVGGSALAYQKKFSDHYLKGMENGWEETPRVRLEVRETRDEYQVRFEKEFPMARTQQKSAPAENVMANLHQTHPKSWVILKRPPGALIRGKPDDRMTYSCSQYCPGMSLARATAPSEPQ